MSHQRHQTSDADGHHYFEDNTASAVIRQYGYPPEQVKDYHQVPEHGCTTCRTLSPRRLSGVDLYPNQQHQDPHHNEPRLGAQFNVYTDRAKGPQFRCGTGTTSNPGSRNASPNPHGGGSRPTSVQRTRQHQQRPRSPPVPPATLQELRHTELPPGHHHHHHHHGLMSRDSAKLVVAVHSAHNIAHVSSNHDLMVRVRLGQFEGLTGLLSNKEWSAENPSSGVADREEGEAAAATSTGIFWEEAFELPMSGSDGLPLEVDLIDATTNRIEGQIRMAAREMDTHPEGAVEEHLLVVPTASKLPPKHHRRRGSDASCESAGLHGPHMKISWAIHSTAHHHRSPPRNPSGDYMQDECLSDGGSSVSCRGFPANWTALVARGGGAEFEGGGEEELDMEPEHLPFEVALTLKVNTFFGSTTKRCSPCWRLTAATGAQLRMGTNDDAAWLASLTLVTTTRYVLLSFHDQDHASSASGVENGQGEKDDFIAARILDLGQMPLRGGDHDLEVFQQPQLYPRRNAASSANNSPDRSLGHLSGCEDSSFLANITWKCDAVAQERHQAGSSKKQSSSEEDSLALCLVVSRAFDLMDTQGQGIAYPTVTVTTGDLQASTSGPTPSGRQLQQHQEGRAQLLPGTGGGHPAVATVNPVWEQEIRFLEFALGDTVDFTICEQHHDGDGNVDSSNGGSQFAVSCASLQLKQKEGNCVLLLHCPRTSTTRCLGELLVSWSTRPLVRRPAPQLEQRSIDTEEDIAATSVEQEQESPKKKVQEDSELEEDSTPDKEAEMARSLQEDAARLEQEAEEQLRQRREAAKKEQDEKDEGEGPVADSVAPRETSQPSEQSPSPQKQDDGCSSADSSDQPRLSSITADSNQDRSAATEEEQEGSPKSSGSPQKQPEEQEETTSTSSSPAGGKDEGEGSKEKTVHTTEEERKQFIARRLEELRRNKNKKKDDVATDEEATKGQQDATPAAPPPTGDENPIILSIVSRPSFRTTRADSADGVNNSLTYLDMDPPLGFLPQDSYSSAPAEMASFSSNPLQEEELASATVASPAAKTTAASNQEATSEEEPPKFLLRFVAPKKQAYPDDEYDTTKGDSGYTYVDSNGRPLPNLPLASVREAAAAKNMWALDSGHTTEKEHADACDEETRAKRLLQEDLDCLVSEDNSRHMRLPLINPNPFYPCGDNEEHILPELRRRTARRSSASTPQRVVSPSSRRSGRSVTPTAEEVMGALPSRHQSAQKEAAAVQHHHHQEEEVEPATRPARVPTGHDLTPLTLSSLGVPYTRQQGGVAAYKLKAKNGRKLSDDLRAMLDTQSRPQSSFGRNGPRGRYQVPWYSAQATGNTPYLTDLLGGGTK